VLSTTTYSCPPVSYGGEVFFYDLAEALAQLNHEVHLFGAPGSKCPTNGFLHYIRGTYGSISLAAEHEVYEVYKDELLKSDFIIDCSHNHLIAEQIYWFDHEHARKLFNVLNGVVTVWPRCRPWNMIVGSNKWKELIVSAISQFKGTPWENSNFDIPLPKRFEETEVHIIPWACLTPETLIFTPSGSYPIKDIVEGDANEVIGFNGSPVITRITAKQKRLISEEILQIDTEMGRTLRVTGEHPVLVKKNEGVEWVVAKRIKEGDVIYTLNEQGFLHDEPTSMEQRRRGDSLKTLSNRHSISQHIPSIVKDTNSHTEKGTQIEVEEEGAVWSKNMEGMDKGTRGDFSKTLDDSIPISDYVGTRSLQLERNQEQGNKVGVKRQICSLRQAFSIKFNELGSCIYSWYNRWRGKRFTNHGTEVKTSHIPIDKHFQHEYSSYGMVGIENSFLAFIKPTYKQRQIWKERSIHRTSGRLSSSSASPSRVSLSHSEEASSRITSPLFPASNEKSTWSLHRRRTADSSGYQGVKFEKISHIRRIFYQGLVYNLETDTHNYIANQIIVHNCDTSFYTPSEHAKQDFFLWVGRPTPYKGLGKAIELVMRADVPFKVLASREILEHQYYGVRFSEMIEKANSKGAKIEMLEEAKQPFGSVFKRELYRNAKALIFPSESNEPFGLVLIEAIACGCPCIVSNLGALPEKIENGVNGFVCKNDEEYLQAIKNIDSISPEACRKVAVEKFDRSVAAQNYLNLYEKLKDKEVA